MLEIKNLSITRKDKKIIDNLSLTLNQGELAILLGPSGAGKSTLLRAINKLEAIDHGSVISSKGSVGMVFQHFNLFEHLSVSKNIELALIKVQKKTTQEAKEIAFKLLKKYGLEDKVNASISQISGGQKQRVAIARTLALNPAIVCMDEPTSALDPTLTEFIASVIKELILENKIVLLITHDTHLVKQLSGKALYLKEGKIIECGQSEEVKRDKSQFKHLDTFYD